PAVRLKVSAGVREAWNNPSYRAKFNRAHFSRMAQALWNRPGMRAFHRAKIADQWTQLDFRTSQRLAVSASNQRRLAEIPGLMSEVAEKAAVSLRHKWADGGVHKRQVMRQRISRYVSGLLTQVPREQITAETYDAHRYANWIPRWERAIPYFDSV